MTAIEDLVGSWNLVSNRNWTDAGEASDPFGSTPVGSLLLMPDGRMTVIMMRSDLPRIAANHRLQGTPEENAAIVKGALAAFGTYEFDPSASTLVLIAEGSTYPNMVGSRQVRPFTISGDTMTWDVTAATIGGRSLIVWRRSSRD